MAQARSIFKTNFFGLVLERVSLADIDASPAHPFIHNTEPITMDDVIIIGGSFAGLAAPAGAEESSIEQARSISIRTSSGSCG